MSVRGGALCQGTLVKRKSISRRAVDVMVTARERALRPVERYAVMMCAAGHILSGSRRTVDVVVSARERALRPVERSDVKTGAAQAGHGNILRRTVCAGDRARTVGGTGVVNVWAGLQLVEAQRTRTVDGTGIANVCLGLRLVEAQRTRTVDGTGTAIVCLGLRLAGAQRTRTVVCIATANV